MIFTRSTSTRDMRWYSSSLGPVHLLVFLFISATLARPSFTIGDPGTITLGIPFILTWRDASGDVTLRLKNGPATNLRTVEVIADNFRGTSYAWTPTSLETGEYTFEISDQSGDEPNYSEWFDLISDDRPQQPSSTASAPISTTESFSEPPPTPTTITSETRPPLSSTSPSTTTIPTPSPAPISEPASGFEGLSTGAKAGIGAGAGASAIILLFLIGYIFYRRGRSAGLRYSASAAAFGGGRNPGPNEHVVEFGGPGNGSARGVYSPAPPESELGLTTPPPPPQLLPQQIMGFSVGVGEGGIGTTQFAGADSMKSVPTPVSTVPDSVLPLDGCGDRGGGGGGGGGDGLEMSQIPETGVGDDATGAGGGTDDGGGGGRVDVDNLLDLNTSPPFAHMQASTAPSPPPGPGVYELPVSHGMVSAGLPAPAPDPAGPLVTGSQSHVVTERTHPYFIEVEGTGRMSLGPPVGSDVREGR